MTNRLDAEPGYRGLEKRCLRAALQHAGLRSCRRRNLRL